MKNEKRPTEGVTRCDCGSKYWDRERDGKGWRCHSCSWPYRPRAKNDE